MLYHLPVHGVRQGPHESGIKVGDEQCRVLAIKRQSSHNVPPVSVYKAQASVGRLAPLRWRVNRAKSTCQKWRNSSPITTTIIGQYTIQDLSNHLLWGGPIMTFGEFLAQVLDLL